MSITKETYKVSDLVFLNDKASFFVGKEPVFPMESISREEKIAIMDSFEDGIASYMLKLIEKYNIDKDTMPKDRWGNAKTISVKAWIKKNDDRNIIPKYDRKSNYEEYRMFGKEYSELSLICGSGRWSSPLYHKDDIVKQWFHDFHIHMQKQERKWFDDNDPHRLKLFEVGRLGEKYGVFGNKLLNDITYNRADAEDQYLDIFLEKFAEVEKLYEIIKDDLEKKLCDK